MKRIFTFYLVSIVTFLGNLNAQSFSPIALTGFNYDAVAEATTAAANTTGPIDGSNYVMYSAAYGAIYSVMNGLPNSGVITSGNYNYQLEPYNVNNMLFLPTGITDSLAFTTPGPYAGLSLLCFSTEGNGTMSVTIRFTDNTTQVVGSQNVTDWYGTATSVISGFDRVSLLTGVPAGVIGNPKMFKLDFPILCSNRSKNIKNIKFQTTSTNPRNCIMAISGAAMPTYTINTTPVSCSGGTNGSATVTTSGGIQPFTFNWLTTPAQAGTSASNLPVGVYSIITQDAGLCPLTTTFAITQTLVQQPSLPIIASTYTLCAGAPVTMTVSGAVNYTWSTSTSANIISTTPMVTTVYTVGGVTSFNCYVTGSVNIVVNQLPVVTFTTPVSLCCNSAQINLAAIPPGGSFVGQNVSSGVFNPSLGAGTKTLSYSYTDINSCNTTVINTIVVNSLPVMGFTLSPTSLCTNSSTLNLVATPGGGTFAGTGVTGTVYTPSVAGVGTQTVTYAYTDPNNCTNNVSSTVAINAKPIVSFQTTKKLFCANSPTLFLNSTPSGGTFSGPGTSTLGVFSPTSAGVGTHNIAYNYTDGNNCSGSAALSVTVSTCAGINENSSGMEYLSIYPNPNAGSFTVKSTLTLELTIVNELGQVVRKLQLDETNSNQVSLESVTPGIYFVTGQSDSQLIKQKIIVSR